MLYEVIDNANGAVIGTIELTPEDFNIFPPVSGDPVLSYREITPKE